MIDTHCHLTFPDFQEPSLPGGVRSVLDEAARHGVSGCVTISTTTRDCVDALAVARRFTNVWCTAGVHPLYSDEGPHDWSALRRCAQDPKCVAWGELGLDNHYPRPARAQQDSVLADQLAFLESCERDGIRKPIVVHCREAFDDLIPVLGRTRFDPSRFVFHCFTGGEGEVRRVLDFGAMVSFTGVVTYRNAPGVRDAARLVPLDRLMVETDAPFLSPEPKRGVRPCSPWMTSLTARFLAQLRGEDWDHFHAGINANTSRFFGIDAS